MLEKGRRFEGGRRSERERAGSSIVGRVQRINAEFGLLVKSPDLAQERNRLA